MANSFEVNITSNLCSLKSENLPQILSKEANILPVKCAVILSAKISFYGNNSGEIKETLFVGEATIKKSQKTLINMNSYLKTLQITCQRFYSTVTSQIVQHLAEFYELI